MTEHRSEPRISYFIQHITITWELETSDMDFLTLEEGTDMLSRNMGKELPLYAA